MSVLTASELKKILETLFNEMLKNGMLPPNVNKDAILDNVVSQISKTGTLNKDDILNSKEIKKALCLAIISETISNAHPHVPNLKFDYSKLFADKKNASGDEIKNELKNSLGNLLKEINKLVPKSKQLSDKELEELLDKMSKTLTKKFMEKFNQTALSQNVNVVETLTDCLTPLIKGLIELYGGNPHFTGGYAFIVQRFSGNAQGIADFNGDNITSSANLDKLNSPEFEADPLGIGNANRERLAETLNEKLNKVVTDVEPEMQQELRTAPNPFSTHFHPPGTH